MRQRPGFALIELFVVIAILGVMIVLLIPAVERNREAARRSQCAERLRLIGIAVHNYEATHRAFPPGAVHAWETPEATPPTVTFWTTNDHGWSAMIMPHMDGVNTYENINFNLPSRCYESDPRGHANTTAYYFQPSWLICPSDGMTGKQFGAWGGTSYVPHMRTYRLTAPLGLGILGLQPNWSPVVSADTVTDGLSKTAMMSEQLMGRWIGGAGALNLDQRFNHWMAADIANDTGVDAVLEMVAACDVASKGTISDLRWSGTSGPSAWDSGRGAYWSQWGEYWSKYYNHVGTPNKPTCTDGTDLNWGQKPPSSHHNGGVHVLMGDGSVQFVGDGIDQMVWLATGTSIGGEPEGGSF